MSAAIRRRSVNGQTMSRLDSFAMQAIAHDQLGLPAINTVCDRSTLTLLLCQVSPR